VPPVGFRNPFLTPTHPSPPLTLVAVIPARYASTRLPGKPLSDIGGRPMIEHVYRRAAEAPGVDAVVVAADDLRIVQAVERFGGVATLTEPTHRTGTDRVAEVAARLDCDIVLNVQGDEPFVEPAMLADLAAPLRADAAVVMTTLCRAITDPGDYENPNVVKVVVDRIGDALYFSRAPVPHRRHDGVDFGAAGAPQPATPWHHIGLYGFRRDFLLRFAALPQTPLELSESLEQLRALEHGFRIRTIPTEYESIGVDTPDDLDRARRRMSVGSHA
jgi:3-deoxy-manno-octulosonate cytidylyltransferase (CMP-KDO synthetase)